MPSSLRFEAVNGENKTDRKAATEKDDAMEDDRIMEQKKILEEEARSRKSVFIRRKVATIDASNLQEAFLIDAELGCC